MTRQRAIVSSKRLARAGRIPRRVSNDNCNQSQCFPLSFAQEQIWLFHQLAPESAAYNIAFNVRLRGPLNLAALDQSLNEMRRRHETLRTVIAHVDGQPVQIIMPWENLPLLTIDLRDLHGIEREVEARRLAIEEARRPFDLSQGPLLRTVLLRMGEEDHVLLRTMHHIISDAWSIEVFLHDLAALYDAFSLDKPSPLRDLPIQFADFGVWKRQRMNGAALDHELDYWKQQLDGLAPTLTLLSDKSRPSAETHQGIVQRVDLPPDLTERIRALSRRENATLFMTLLAALSILLSRYDGQEDLAIGSVISDRQRVETRGLIGLLLNTVVLRTDLSGDPTFLEVLKRVREVTLAAYSHQDAPFIKLVENLQPKRSLSHHPLFQIFLVIEPPTEEHILRGLKHLPFDVTTGGSLVDLTLQIREEGKGLRCDFIFNSNLFDGSAIQLIGSGFRTLLESIVSNSEQCISDIPLLTAQERHKLLREWNDTSTDYPRDKAIHQLFEEQVKRTPGATAVICGEDRLTYEELNERANQLAHYLQRLGVGPEVLVGIFLERSIEMVIGLLGILKAGGAYVPLNPQDPLERKRFMLEDTRALALITQEQLLGVLPETDAQVICLDREQEDIARMSKADLRSEVSADNLCYVIYTSGSTGMPKGVQIPHCAVVNLLTSIAHRPGMNSEDTLLAVTTLCFDIAGLEIFLPLSIGARLVITRHDALVDGVQLSHEIASSGATVMQATPTTWRLLLESGWQGRKGLKILCGGEALPQELADELLKRNGSLWNLYGPTETTIWSTIDKIVREVETVRIGRPISNTEIYILDRHQQPVPIGVSGEIYIGGAGLARGYLNRSDLTHEKFIPSPFGPEGARLYRTGDRARYLTDGAIEFLGRIDHQVKVRGFRIELGEVESTLNGHPSVRESVVTAPDDADGNKRLVAYFVPANQYIPKINELRSYLNQKLPEYMMPSTFVVMEQLPLTPNGKVDRLALPPPNQSRPELDCEYQSPRTQVQEILAALWSNVLNLTQVGIDDNFFELGGHSLLATQLIARVRDAFRLALPLRTLFEFPTVASLAEKVESALRDEPGPLLPPLRKAVRSLVPLSFSQQRLWFLDQLEPGNISYNLPRAVRLKGELKLEALHQALNQIVDRHESLRTRFAAVDGKPVQVISERGELELPVIDVSQMPDRKQEAEKISKEEVSRAFDLAHGPLMRAKVLKVSENEHILLLTVHHIVSDEWSMGVLFKELGALYTAYSLGQPSPLSELPIQYADYAVWQREWLQGQALDRQVSYWRNHLLGAPAVLELPTRRPRPAVQTNNGAYQSMKLPIGLTEGLRAIARGEGITLYMLLLAAFKVLLFRYTGQEDIVLGTDVANRTQTETENLIGFFVNLLAIRTDLSGNPTFVELLKRVKEVALGAYAHQDLPFEKLVEELQPERDLSRNPVVQVLFVFHNIPRQTLELSDLSLSFIPIDGETSRFDLVLFMRETEQGVVGTWLYNRDLFEAGSMARMANNFQRLLESIVIDPETRLDSLEVLSEVEKEQRRAEKRDRQESQISKLRSIKRRAVHLS